MSRRMIAILEDDPNRVAAMREVLGRDLAAFAVAVFGKAPDMIAWLRDHLCETRLISLDNDLIDPDTLEMDVGEGCDVAKALARASPSCPVILHASNSRAADEMAEALGEAGWPLCRVVPYDGVAWVAEDWGRHVRRILSSAEGQSAG